MKKKDGIAIIIVCIILSMYTLFNVYEDISRLLGSSRRVTTRRGREELYEEDLIED